MKAAPTPSLPACNHFFVPFVLFVDNFSSIFLDVHPC